MGVCTYGHQFTKKDQTDSLLLGQSIFKSYIFSKPSSSSLFNIFNKVLYGTSANSVSFNFDTSKIAPLLFLQYSLTNLV